MAELLGAGSGVLGVAEVGFSLASTLYKYASSVKGAEKELKAIAKDVELTSKVLKQAHEQLQKDRDGKLCTNEAIDVTSDVLEGCRDAFQEVDNELKRSIKTEAGGKSTLSLTSRLKFPLKSNKMELLRANLEKLKTTLLLMLSVLAYGRKISSTYVLISQRFARMFS
jgi:polyhydroxyalkanoate synthesis regulator phasin